MSVCSSLAGWRLLARPMARRMCAPATRACWLQRPQQQASQPWRALSRGAFCVRAALAAETAPAAAAAAAPPLGPQNVVAVLRSRGLLQEVTSPELEAACSREQLLVYCGFDPTAESLHLGNLLGILVLAWFQRCGHRPVALLGGATGRVGDPSGKSAERPVLSEEAIERNVTGIEATLRKLLVAPPESGIPEPLVLNNLQWFGPMGFLQFLREIGKYARVGTMVAKDSVRRRMESEAGISFTEFSYQLLQGYDFVHLRREYGVRVQVGGSDQWGNITAGTDLIRRMIGGPEEASPAAEDGTSAASSSSSSGEEEDEVAEVAAEQQQCFGLTFPLLLKADGTKFGKSESGALWLNGDMLSPYQFYQSLFKTADADVGRFLRMLTFLPLEEIAALEAAMQVEGYQPNTAQRRLAEEVTRFVHGEQGLQQALKATAAMAPGAATVLDAATLEAIAEDAPSATLRREQLVGAQLADVMVAVGMQPSKAAVRRMIKGGGVRVNNEKVADELHELQEADLIEGRSVLIAAGKKNKMLVQVG